MKKIHFMLIFVVICAFLFAACGQDFDFSTIIDAIRDKNWENEQKPPVVVPPDNITVSVTVDYELNGWDGDILVKLILSEGEWDNFLLWPDGGSMSNAAMAADKAAVSKWITLSFPPQPVWVSSIWNYDPVLLLVGGGYDYIDTRDDSGNRVAPKALFFRFKHGYPHPGVCISEEQNAENFSRWFPITVTLNEEKLAEMKKYTDVTGSLVAGTKTVTLDRLYKGEGQKETNLLEKYGLSLQTYIWNDYMPVIGPSEHFTRCSISFNSATELPSMEVSATIITERITMPNIELYDIYNGSGTYGKLFRKDFRPVNGFRLNDGEEYTIKITVKISGEQQAITFENQKVDVTW